MHSLGVIQSERPISQIISTHDQRSFIRRISKNLFYMERTQQISHRLHLIDVFTSVWILGLASPPRGMVKIRSGKKLYELQGPVGICIPPFSIVNWILEPGEMKWNGFASEGALPASLPKFPFVFSWDQKLPVDEKSIFDLLEHSNKIGIHCERRISAVGRRVKSILDQRFKENIKIQAIADEMGLSRVVMAREFKSAYGFSPVYYRHRLRIFDAIRLMGTGTSVTQACYEVGYRVPGRFSRYFRKFMDTNPSQYNLSRSFSFSPNSGAMSLSDY